MTRTPSTEHPAVSLGFVEEISFRDITQLQVVGKGAFGVVHKGRWRDKFVAIKKIDSDAERRAFAVEIRQLSRVNHANIVTLYGACTDPVCLVMEYAEGGSLYNVLHGSPQVPYTAAHAMSWCYQTACGVAYLHGMNPKPLIHRDLKPPNLLLISGGTVLKICDFGTACDKQTYMTNSKGSAAWMAPEVFESNAYTEKCDIFSWGIILWEVITRRKPFDDIGGPAFRIMWAVHKGERPPPIADCPPAIDRLMSSCWDRNPDNRPTMQRIVEVMTHICELFPGADEPLQYPTPASSNFQDDSIPFETQAPGSLEDDNESISTDDQEHVTDIPGYPSFSNTVNGVVQTATFGTLGKTLSNTLPPSQINLPPLNIEVDKNAWEFGGESDDILAINRPIGTEISAAPGSSTRPQPQRPTEIKINKPRTQVSESGSSLAMQMSRDSSHSQPSLATITDTNATTVLKPDRQGMESPKPRPPPKPTTLAWKPNMPVSVTGPALVNELRVPPQGHRRTASDGSDKIFSGASRDQGNPGSEYFGNRNESAGGGDSLYDNAYLMLDPEFQPISPATDIPESMRIFEEHKKLAKDYLQTRTEIECLLQAKKDLEEQLREQEKYGPFGGQRDSQRILREWRELKSENESLVQYHRNLKKQLEIIKSRKQTGQPSTAGTQEFEPEPGWVMVSRKEDSDAE